MSWRSVGLEIVKRALQQSHFWGPDGFLSQDRSDEIQNEHLFADIARFHSACRGDSFAAQTYLDQLIKQLKTRMHNEATEASMTLC